MIDVSFGCRLEQPLLEASDALIATEFELFCEGKCETAATAELYQKSIILKFKVRVLLSRSIKEQSSSKSGSISSSSSSCCVRKYRKRGSGACRMSTRSDSPKKRRASN
jgi:hypothetical protein